MNRSPFYIVGSRCPANLKKCIYMHLVKCVGYATFLGNNLRHNTLGYTQDVLSSSQSWTEDHFTREIFQNNSFYGKYQQLNMDSTTRLFNDKENSNCFGSRNEAS